MEDLRKEEKNLRQNINDFEIITREKLRLCIEKSDLEIKNKQCELFLSTLEQETENRDKLCSLLQKQLDKLKMKNENINDEDRMQLNKL